MCEKADLCVWKGVKIGGDDRIWFELVYKQED